MLEIFQELFGSTEALRSYRAPGRVNLIGEHTDYNLGFVLPVALDLATTVMMAPSHDGMVRIYSQQRQEMRQWKADEIAGLVPAHDWSDYPIGVARELIQAGFPIQPSNLLISSTVPEGSGLSSSAALEVSSALALLHGRTLNPMELALLCQRAERNFVGMPCGIMDQYISVFGKQNSAVEIDCRSLAHRLVSLPAGITFVAVNSMVKHALASSAYHERVAQCAAAVSAIREQFPAVASLRDATLEQLATVTPQLPEVVVRRARHVITEDERVGRFVEAAASGDPFRMGRLMLESHASLKNDYEVSCEELDFLVDAARDIDDVYGSRMTGGGFGGCTVTLMDAAAAPAFGEQIEAAYRQRYGVTPAVYPCRPSDGAGEV
jgi:galactokinase